MISFFPYGNFGKYRLKLGGRFVPNTDSNIEQAVPFSINNPSDWERLNDIRRSRNFGPLQLPFQSNPESAMPDLNLSPPATTPDSIDSGSSVSPPTPSTTPAALPSISMEAMAQQMQAYLQFQQFLQQAAQPVQPPAAPALEQTIPTFQMQQRDPLGKSIIRAFPDLASATIISVLRHDMEPVDIFKLDPSLTDRVKADPTLQASFGLAGNAKNYPTPSSLLIPFGVYTRLLVYHAKSSAVPTDAATLAFGLSAYTSKLLQWSDEFTWEAVLNYHVRFHNRRLRDMREGDYDGWLEPTDVQLAPEFLWRHPLPLKSKLGGALAAASKSGRPVEEQYCHRFQAGDCSGSECPAGRLHKCSMRACGSLAHGRDKCPKVARAGKEKAI